MGSSPSAPSPSGRTLGWVRIIETLSDWKLVPVGLLSRLIAAVPDFYAAAPEAVRERVALRYLRECATRGLVRSPPTAPVGDAGAQQSSSAEEFLCKNLALRFPAEPSRMSADVPVTGEIERFILEKWSKLPEPYLGDAAVGRTEQEVTPGQQDEIPAATATEHKQPAPKTYIPTELTTDANNNNEASEISADLLDDIPDIEISPVDSQISVSQHDDQCIVCNKGGGELLTCSTELCGLTVHKACILISPISFDKGGRFFCPCCACTRAARVSERAQELLARAKESMSSFVGMREGIRQQKGEKGKQLVDGMMKERKTQFGNIDVEKDRGAENEKRKRKRGNGDGNRRHKPRPRYSNKVAAPSRRKILPWTKEEEQVLREGMQKFEVGHDGRISWSTILQFGKDVFHKSRLPIDLKDKWRNMIKREGSVSL